MTGIVGGGWSVRCVATTAAAAAEQAETTAPVGQAAKTAAALVYSFPC